ncbi:fibroblast growth factor receptor 4-like [Ptychodera flava]|uniref:fibroblast growth factor receptor 4-like n=1 Tax=Ptychodera flava TaxID=63121 RepID=UPI00396A85AF
MEFNLFVVFVSIAIFTSGSWSAGVTCPQVTSPRVRDNHELLLDLDEDIVVPKETTLLLNSTMRVGVSQNICINITTSSGASERIACSSIAIESKYPRMLLQDIDGYLMLKVEELTASDDKAVFTWWSAGTDPLGETMVTVLDEDNDFTACGRKGRTMHVVFNLGFGRVTDVALKTSKPIDIYNYQPSTPWHCWSLNKNILPSYETPFYMTTFQHMEYTMKADYIFTVTRPGHRSKRPLQKMFDVHIQESIDVRISVSHQPNAFGDNIDLQCSASDDIATVDWIFQGNVLHSDIDLKSKVFKYEVPEFQQQNIGNYSCRVRTNCGSIFYSEDLEIGIKGRAHQTTKIIDVTTEMTGVTVTSTLDDNDTLPVNQEATMQVTSTQRTLPEHEGSIQNDYVSILQEATTQVTSTQRTSPDHEGSIQNHYVSTFQDPLSTQSVLPKDGEKHLFYPIFFLSGMLAVVVAYLLVITIRRNINYGNNNDADIERTNGETYNEDISLSVSQASTGDASSTSSENNSLRTESLLDTRIGSVGTSETSVPLLTSGYINGPFDATIDIEYHHLRFSEDNILGRGEFGVVRRASVENANHMSGHKEVAVKCLKANASIDNRKDLLRELDILKSLQSGHPHIVTLLGWCTQDPIYIILELAPYGSLHDYLITNRAWELYENIHPNSRDLTSHDLLQFAWQIAKGMSFIASKQCTHRDLAARNVLVGHERCCKISDFGLARRVSDSFVEQRTTQMRLPVRWMALESLLSSTYTTKSDIWSYGIVLWEIVTLGSTPYAGMPAKKVIQKLKCGYRLPKPNHCSNECYQIMEACWQQQPEVRPTFSDICLKVGHLVSDETQEHLEMESFEDRIYVNISLENWPSRERL